MDPATLRLVEEARREEQAELQRRGEDQASRRLAETLTPGVTPRETRRRAKGGDETGTSGVRDGAGTSGAQDPK